MIYYEEGYIFKYHNKEIEMAFWLEAHYGGDIILLNDIHSDCGVKTPDYLWNGELWEYKTLSSSKAASSAIRKAMKQIKDNPGGIILDFEDRKIDINKAKKEIHGRMNRYIDNGATIILISSAKMIEIIDYKKLYLTKP